MLKLYVFACCYCCKTLGCPTLHQLCDPSSTADTTGCQQSIGCSAYTGSYTILKWHMLPQTLSPFMQNLHMKVVRTQLPGLGHVLNRLKRNICTCTQPHWNIDMGFALVTPAAYPPSCLVLASTWHDIQSTDDQVREGEVHASELINYNCQPEEG